MSNEKQDLINHRLTATACKNYTDKEIKKAKDELKTFFSKNIVNTEDHTNELAYQITAPSGAKLLQLQAIGGNSVKYEPSVASDDTTALIKTMPSVVYDFDVNKVKGVSEVSENLIVLNDMVETTTEGLTYSIKDGVITLNGTATNRVYFTFAVKVITDENYSYKVKSINADDNSFDIAYVVNSSPWYTKTVTSNEVFISQSIPSGFSSFQLWANSGYTFNNVKIYPMVVKGSTAPNEFKVGFEGIHNNELTGIRSEGVNVFGSNDVATRTNVGVTSKVENNTFYLNGTSDDYGVFLTKTNLLTPIKAGTYNVRFFVKSGTGTNIWIDLFDANGNVIISKSITTTTETITLTKDIVAYRLFNWSGSTYTNFYICISFSRSVVNAYSDYVPPIDIPIDLTSIVDSSGNKLFEDGSLKGINDVYDEITPYKAIKRFGIVDLGTLNWAKNTTNTSGKYRMVSSGLSSLIKATTSDGLIGNILCSKYTTGSANDTWLNNNNVINVDKNANIHVYDENYQDNVDFKKAMSGVYLVYELAAPIEADIDLSQLKNIQGHSNGSITALNTYDMPVPSEIRYNSIIQDTLVDSVSVEGANIYSGASTYSGIMNNTIAGTIDLGNLPNGTYTISFNVIANTRIFSIYRALNNVINSSAVIDTRLDGTGLKTYTFTLDNSIPYDDIRLGVNTATNNYSVQLKDLMLEKGSTTHYYRPYKETITRNLPTITSDGYGINANVHNLRLFSDYEGNEVNKRYTNVDIFDIGLLNWQYLSDNLKFVTANDIQTLKSSTINILCSSYTTINPSWSSQDVMNKSIATHNAGPSLLVKDLDYDNATIFKKAKTGEPLYYELADASKTETDLDSFDYFFDVEEGDTITFNNPYAQQVYATYSFIIKEVKSNE